MHGQDEARFFRFGFHFLPQSNNVRIHRARGGETVVAPHIFQQAIAAQGFARMAKKIFKQLEFLGGKIEFLAPARNLATLQITSTSPNE